MAKQLKIVIPSKHPINMPNKNKTWLTPPLHDSIDLNKNEVIFQYFYIFTKVVKCI